MYWEPNLEMMCPICRTKLIVDPNEKTFIYEDAALSSCNTWKYICSNDNCICCQKKDILE